MWENHFYSWVTLNLISVQVSVGWFAAVTLIVQGCFSFLSAKCGLHWVRNQILLHFQFLSLPDKSALTSFTKGLIKSLTQLQPASSFLHKVFSHDHIRSEGLQRRLWHWQCIDFIHSTNIVLRCGLSSVPEDLKLSLEVIDRTNRWEK